MSREKCFESMFSGALSKPGELSRPGCSFVGLLVPAYLLNIVCVKCIFGG